MRQLWTLKNDDGSEPSCSRLKSSPPFLDSQLPIIGSILTGDLCVNGEQLCVFFVVNRNSQALELGTRRVLANIGKVTQQNDEALVAFQDNEPGSVQRVRGVNPFGAVARPVGVVVPMDGAPKIRPIVTGEAYRGVALCDVEGLCIWLVSVELFLQ